MLKVQLFPLYLSCILFMFSTISSSTTFTTAKRGCPTKCGNITIPYPFGVNQEGYSCSLSRWYDINCTNSKPFWGQKNLEVMEISQAGQMRIKNSVARKCYNNEAGIANNQLLHINLATVDKLSQLDLDGKAMPIVFSHTANKFNVIGCDDMAVVFNGETVGIVGGCFAMCSNLESLLKYNGSCSGIGCCQTSIPKGFTRLTVQVNTVSNHSRMTDDFSPCSLAFLGEEDKFTFNVDDLSDPSFVNRTRDDVPIVLEWVVGIGKTCFQAQQNMSSYACQYKATCSDIDIGLSGGYRCKCLPGYEGNPYLSPGCTDIDECTNSNNPCSDICTNTPGSFICSCPKGRRGDGLKTGSGCSRNQAQLVRELSLGVSFGVLSLLILVGLIMFTMRRRKLMKIREKLFDQNGGLLLLQRLSVEHSSKIFTENQLKTATNNYSSDRILGKGSVGTVYRGLLNGRDVAIKKPKPGDQDISFQTHVQEFVDEIRILLQADHKNVVELLGCCLETKVPILVYEYISSGTLLKHIRERTAWLNWENCIRVASEIADALAHLHSKVSTPIIHRNIKSANILLDENNTAKIADFGASMLAPIGQTRASLKRVPETFGYLDPKSLHTGRLTEKSDVYSFGVVLAELLTKKNVISLEKTLEEASLAKYFVSSMEKDRLLEILDPQLGKEASEEQLHSVGKLVMRCLDINSENRPTMRQIADELDDLKIKLNQHPWVADEQSYNATTGFVSQQDLHLASSSIGFNSSS